MKNLIRFGLLLTLTVFTLLNTSCKKENVTTCDGEIGIFKDFTGLDGCGILLELEDTSRLEFTNLALFDIELGEEYCVTYEEQTDMGSVCMAGKIVEILTLEKL